jgi:pyruvate carboxylase
MDDKEIPISDDNISSYCIYPKVFSDYVRRYKQFGDLSVLDTPTFFFGMNPGEEVHVNLEEGKMLLIRMDNITRPDENGDRIVQFEINGMPREIRVHDKHVEDSAIEIKKANPDVPGEVGATLSGKVVKILVAKGDKVEKGDPIIVTEAMKMETTLTAPVSGTIKEIATAPGTPIESGDLLLVIEE